MGKTSDWICCSTTSSFLNCTYHRRGAQTSSRPSRIPLSSKRAARTPSPFVPPQRYRTIASLSSRSGSFPLAPNRRPPLPLTASRLRHLPRQICQDIPHGEDTRGTAVGAGDGDVAESALIHSLDGEGNFGGGGKRLRIPGHELADGPVTKLRRPV